MLKGPLGAIQGNSTHSRKESHHETLRQIHFGSEPLPPEGQTSRGFKSDRFTGNDLALVTAEYRYPIWDSIDAFLLLDAGRVFDQIEDDFRLRNWEWNYGFGMRVWKTSGLILSATFARSNEETRYYLSAGEEF